MKTKILILGKTPPPVGGVTVHVSRLIGGLERMQYKSFLFSDLNKEPGWKVLLRVLEYRVIHLHTSSPHFQFVMAMFCFTVRKKLIVTYHGNWGRYGLVKNLSTAASALLTFIPIVQNQSSLGKALRLNKNTELVSSFIPSSIVKPLSNEVVTRLLDLRKKYKYLVCTNAWNLTFDKNGHEIYGISALVLKITALSGIALIVSDPSGTYLTHLERIFGKMPDAIFLITGAHEFDLILGHVDAYVRNTTTDGDSISVHEALVKGITVFASDCVPRPVGCQLFSDVGQVDLVRGIENGKLGVPLRHLNEPGTIETLVGIYEYCLQQRR